MNALTTILTEHALHIDTIQSGLIILHKQKLIFSQIKFFEADGIWFTIHWLTGQSLSWKVRDNVKVIRAFFVTECEVIQVLKNINQSYKLQNVEERNTPLPDSKKLALFNFKALANNKLNVTQSLKFVFYRARHRKHCEKRRKCWLFLLYMMSSIPSPNLCGSVNTILSNNQLNHDV